LLLVLLSFINSQVISGNGNTGVLISP